uniref:G patch domain-containing protein 11 n=1 Tax=Glossina palpalis gambiensis TaxID=67801 RepID=A0A1B0C411_9MUSC
MSGDEEDYMSDKFLNGGEDVRPSLIYNRAKKRELAVAEKQEEVVKKQKRSKKERLGFMDNETLQDALKKPLSNDNKGFQMLAKMGYKAGQTLGKSITTTNKEQKSATEPIGITLKCDRQGLGREAALKELKEKRREIMLKRLLKQNDGEISLEEYRKRAAQKAEERSILNALRKCQTTCENLDREAQIEKPEMYRWFWYEKETEETEDLETTENDIEEDCADDDYTNAEKLEMLTSYLRTAYRFCYWCGIHYESDDDILGNCPGLNKDDH